VWQTTTGRGMAPPFLGVGWAELGADGQELITVAENGAVRIWDFKLGRFVSEAKFSPEQFRLAVFTPTGARVVIAEGPDVQVVDLRTRKPTTAKLKGPSVVEQVYMSQDGSRLFVFYKDNEPQLWNAAAGHPFLLRRSNTSYEHVEAAEFSADGRWVITLTQEASARVWSADDGDPRTQPLSNPGPPAFPYPHRAAFSRDQRYVLLSASDGSAFLFDAVTGDRVAAAMPLPALCGTDAQVALRPDSRVLLAACDSYVDGFSTQVVAAVRELHPDPRSPDIVESLAHVMAGRRVDGSGALLELTPDELQHEWERFRNLSAQR
jgi:WD40 repeat protein